LTRIVGATGGGIVLTGGICFKPPWQASQRTCCQGGTCTDWGSGGGEV